MKTKVVVRLVIFAVVVSASLFALWQRPGGVFGYKYEATVVLEIHPRLIAVSGIPTGRMKAWIG